ncbi:MAG: MarR family transcriptional regulator [Dorea sp.]
MHGWLLRYLYENDENSIYQKDIEHYFSVGRSSVTGTLKALERLGYVYRESVENDARLKRVRLTEKGRKTHETLQSVIDGLDKQLVRGIEKEDIEIFLSVVEINQKEYRTRQQRRRKKDDSYIIKRSKRV